MFNSVKARLTILYTASLLIILALFIFILYWFISGAIEKEQKEELKQYFEKEKHEFFEDIEEREYDHIKFKPERHISYYLYDYNDQLIEGEETVKGLSDYINKNNSTFEFSKELELNNVHLLLMKFSIEDDDRILGSVIMGMDITNEKHIIKNIIWILLILTVLFSLLFAFVAYVFAGQAIKPIQRAFQTQKKFVSDASHELRTPLSIFYSSIDLLEREEKDHLSSFGKEILGDVKKETEVMNKLLNDLLFLARHDQERIELEREQIDVSFLVNELVNRFSRIVPPNLTFSHKIEENLSMVGDPVRIQQLVYILLDNAIRYTKEGTITCSLREIHQKIELKVEDTGMGIPLDDIEHVFDRFYRGDKSRKRDGSGLGLAIAKSIVDAHEGKITVKSEINRGTAFIVHFKNK